jgi:riboflavin transporter FmnP
MFNRLQGRRIGAREVAVASTLGAVSAMLEYQPGLPFDIAFPLYPKISWDFTGIPIMISLFLCGTLSSIYTCLIGCSIIFFRGNISGGIFKLAAELATIVGYAAFRKNFSVDTVKATLSRVLAMTVANYYLLPIFYRMPPAVAAGLLAPIAAFNVSQALINILPAYAIYRKIANKVYSENQLKEKKPP